MHKDSWIGMETRRSLTVPVNLDEYLVDHPIRGYVPQARIVKDHFLEFFGNNPIQQISARGIRYGFFIIDEAILSTIEEIFYAQSHSRIAPSEINKEISLFVEGLNDPQDIEQT